MDLFIFLFVVLLIFFFGIGIGSRDAEKYERRIRHLELENAVFRERLGLPQELELASDDSEYEEE